MQTETETEGAASAPQAPLDRERVIVFLAAKGACKPALAWFCETPGTPAELWEKCPDGTWMSWLLCEVEVDNYFAITHRASDYYHCVVGTARDFYHEAVVVPSRRCYESENADTLIHTHCAGTVAASIRAYNEIEVRARRTYAVMIAGAIPWSVVESEIRLWMEG